MSIDLSEFKKQDKTAWFSAAEKALKGNPLSELTWKVDNSISIDPFYTNGETVIASALPYPRRDNGWLIGESFNGENPSFANDQLLKALAMGLDSPLFFDVDAIDICLGGVSVDYIFPIFRGEHLNKYLQWVGEQDIDASQLQGGFIVFEASYDSINISDSMSDLKTISAALPKYYHSQISIAIDPEDLAQSIGSHLTQLSELIFQLMSNDIPVKVICEIETDNDFLKNVATLRALRLLNTQICEAYDLPLDSIFLDVYVNQISQDVQLGMIGASSQAMSAVTAGADRLTIHCEAINIKEDEEVTRRMTRNIHHLMKMESGLDQVLDPLAGSYSIEKLTREIAQRSWKIFQNKQK